MMRGTSPGAILRAARGRVADWAFGFGRIVGTVLGERARGIYAAVQGIGEDEDDDGGVEGSATDPLFSAIGVVARPRVPVEADQATGTEPEGACEAVFARFGDELVPIAYRDFRLTARVNPKDGEVCVVGYGGGFLSLADCTDLRGTVATLYAPKLKADGTIDKAHALFLDPEANSVGLVHADGPAVLLTEAGLVIKNAGGDGFLELAETQTKLSAQTMFLTGGSFILYVPNKAGTKAHLIAVDDGDGSVTIAQRDGAALVLGSDGSAVLKSDTGDASIILKGDTVTITGSLMVNGACRLGGVGAISAVLHGAPPGVASTKVFVSP